MLPARLLCFDAVGDRLVPRLLTEADHPWLLVLLAEHSRLEGRTWGELRARMAEPLPCPSPGAKRAAAWHVLVQLGSRRPAVEGAKPRELRLELCLEAQRVRSEGGRWCRREIMGQVAARSGLSIQELERALFADRPEEQVVQLPVAPLDPAGLALRVNEALVRGLLRRALEVRVRLRGNARAVVRQVQLMRLLCTVRGAAEVVDTCDLEISGAYALFRRTTMYGRRLGSLVPVLQWCQRFELEARCVLGGRELTLQLATGAPIFPSVSPRRFDSKVEERFARDFGKLADGWELLREPAPLQAGERLFFPDFELRPAGGGRAPWFMEIVGFWSPEYLERKLADLRAARVTRLLLCIDRALGVAEEDLPEGLPVIWYRGRVDAAAVLIWVEEHALRAVDEEPQTSMDVLGLGDMFLDFAGRRPPHDAIHARLASLRPRDRVELEARGSRVLVVVPGSGVIAALSGRSARTWRPRLEAAIEACVERVVERSVEDAGPGYRDAIRCARWLVPLVRVRWST